ncbi:MAG: CoA transferase [Dehalococcoidia bacterium]|nr:CoA transferase [Dehalococcoidia bacterium]
MDRPLAGIRVLSMEQAAALPFATRHLADLGAEVIRVESHGRARPSSLSESDLLRNKRRVGIDLGAPGGPEVFRRLAAEVDVVAHNFTPRVMRKYGIDFPSIRQVNPDVVYVSITGFGTTGPWGERPLFGPGAEAVSGHNLMIGEADAWPGRPGTIVYADNNTGLNAAFAILAALDHRDATGEAVHIDLSLYEASIAHMGVAVTERAFGAPLPTRIGNADPRDAVHGVFATRAHDRHVAIAASEADLPALARVLGLTSTEVDAVRAAVAEREAEDVAEALQAAGVPAHVVADAADVSQDAHLWARGFFGVLPGGGPHAGPAFGGGADLEMAPPHRLGEDNEHVLTRIAGLTAEEVEAARAAGAIGEGPQGLERPRPADSEVRIERGELSRVDEVHDGWRRVMG